MKTVYLRNRRANRRRVLRPEDLERHGVPNPKGAVLVWDKGNNFGVVMSNRMSDSLVAAFPDEFKAVDGEDGDDDADVSEPMTSLTSSSASGSLANATESVAASGRAGRSTGTSTTP